MTTGLAFMQKPAPDPAAEFRDVLIAAGIHSAEVVPDGVIHRCGTADHPRSQNGWYVLHPDPYAGAFGDWATGTSEKWSCGGTISDTDRDRLRVEIDRQRAERESRLSEIQSAAAQRAREYLSGLKPATALNGYLINKGVKPCPGLLALDNQLVVPVLSPDDNQPMSFQTIIPFRKPKEKLFLSGGRVKGGFFPIKGKDGPLLICEGIATGLSIHHATGLTVLVAFSTTNLANVAMMARGRYPERRIILCADDDAKEKTE